MPDRLTCQQTFRQLNDYLDGELDPEILPVVEEHLETCVVCAKEYHFVATLLRGVRDKLRRSGLPADARDRIESLLADVTLSE
jgi:predicted anti-sigma-YlaC factor YlaD